MFRIIVGVSAIVVLGACANNQMAPFSGGLADELKIIRPAVLSAKQTAMLHKAVSAKLRDPDSARFSEHLAAGYNNRGIIHVCGRVNSKNGFGGFAGMTMFMAEVTDTEASVKGFSGGADYICQQQGLIPSD